MAKDPAFLFYPGDWNLGTMHMNTIEKGAYITLLMLQFSQDKFTLAHAKHMLHDSFDVAWATVSKKFVTDGEYYWNERLELEKEKRRIFTESRRSNGSQRNQPKKSSKALAKHMHKHMEDENVNENTVNNSSVLTQLEIQNSIEFLSRLSQINLTESQVKNFWVAFLIHTEEEPPVSRSRQINHFRNWLKKQDHATTKRDTAKPGTILSPL